MSYPTFQVPAGDVLPVMFASYAGSTGASVTLTGLAVTDIEIYKDGSVTQRASDAGYTLLDTDGIDFDGITGIHGFSIDTGDNTDAGFYTTGAWFTVVVSAVTVDSQTVNFIACQFRIMAAESVAGTPAVDVTAISSDATAANNAESFFDGTGYAGTNNVIPTVTTVTNQLTAAQIATGVWQDATAGDFTAASSIGKALYVANVAPGGAGGHLISGSNSGTTTLAALTVTGALTTGSKTNNGTLTQTGNVTITGTQTHAGRVTMSEGLSVLCTDGAQNALRVEHNAVSGAYPAMSIRANNPTANALDIYSDSGAPLNVVTFGSSAAASFVSLTGNGVHIGGANGVNISASGNGIDIGAAGNGIDISSDGVGVAVATTAAHGVSITAAGASKHGVIITGGSSGTSDGMKLVAGTGGVALRAATITGDITGNLSGSVGSVTGAVGSVTGNVGGNVVGSVASVTAAVTVGTISANVITASALATDAVAEIADGVWDEALAGHAAAGSTGEALSAAGSAGDPWTTALPGAYVAGSAGSIIGRIPDIAAGAAGGLFIAGANAGTTVNLTGNLSGSVGSVTGAVGSVTGAVGSVTGNVGGNVTGSVGSVVGAVGSVTGAVGSVTAGVTVTTNNDKTGYALSSAGSAAMTEGYAALGAAATLPQLLYEVRALLAEKSISGTTLTAKKLNGSTTAATYTLDDATTPSAITRAT